MGDSSQIEQIIFQKKYQSMLQNRTKKINEQLTKKRHFNTIFEQKTPPSITQQQNHFYQLANSQINHSQLDFFNQIHQQQKIFDKNGTIIQLKHLPKNKYQEHIGKLNLFINQKCSFEVLNAFKCVMDGLEAAVAIESECFLEIIMLQEMDSEWVVNSLIGNLIFLLFSQEFQMFQYGIVCFYRLVVGKENIKNILMKCEEFNGVIEEIYTRNKQDDEFSGYILWFLSIYSTKITEQNSNFVNILDEQIYIQYNNQSNIELVFLSLMNLSRSSSQNIIRMNNFQLMLQYSNQANQIITECKYKIVANITKPAHSQLFELVNNKFFLDFLCFSFEINNSFIVEILINCMNNLFSCGENIIQFVLNHKNILKQYLTFLNSEPSLKKPFLESICSLYMNSSLKQIKILNSEGIFDILVECFQLEDFEVTFNTLSVVIYLINKGEINGYLTNSNLKKFLLENSTNKIQLLREKCEYILKILN